MNPRLATLAAIALTLSALATWLLLRSGTSPDCRDGEPKPDPLGLYRYYPEGTTWSWTSDGEALGV